MTAASPAVEPGESLYCVMLCLEVDPNLSHNDLCYLLDSETIALNKMKGLCLDPVLFL